MARALFFPKMYWNPLMTSPLCVSTMRENLDGNFRPFRRGERSSIQCCVSGSSISMKSRSGSRVLMTKRSKKYSREKNLKFIF
jgi:hypothetical protein